jgi:hypothetical protein
MSEDIRKMIDKVKNFKQFVNENINNISTIREYIYKHFNLNNIIEPASTPIKNGNVRLYHQTNQDSFEKIKNDGKINIEKSTGKLNSEPVIVWGSIVKDKNDNGFYGKPKERFTIEYQVPDSEVDKGSGGVNRDIRTDEIIAYHDPRLFNIKEIVDDSDYLTQIINNLDFFMEFNSDNKLSNEYAYYLIANAIKNMN